MEKIVLLKDNQGNNLYPNSYSEAIKYDKSESGLSAENVQDAIDETNQKWRVRVENTNSGDSESSGSGNEGSGNSGSGNGNTPTTAFDYYESEPLATSNDASYDQWYNIVRWKNVPTTSVDECEVRLKPHSTYTFNCPKVGLTIYAWKRLVADNGNYPKPGDTNNIGWWNQNNVVIFSNTTKNLNNSTNSFEIQNNTDNEVGYVFTVEANYAEPLTFTLQSSDYVEPSGDDPVEPEPGGGDEPTPSEPEVQYEEYDAEKLLEKMQDMIDDAMQSSSQTPSQAPSQVVINASGITFNHSTNNLSAENVQAAIEEVNTKVDSIATSDDSSETSLLWENITHIWKVGSTNAIGADTGVYIMNAGIGEKFTQSTATASPGYCFTRNVYKVEPGDKIKFTFTPYSGYTYAYYIIGANDRIIAVGNQPIGGHFENVEITIPSGAELFVFNYRFYNQYYSVTVKTQKVEIRRNKNNSLIHDVMYKDSDLVGLSERRNLSSKDTYRNKLLTLAWITDTHGDERNYRRFIEYVNAHAGVIDAIIHTGDMCRMGDTDSGFSNTVGKYESKVPFLPVMGNHDSHGTSNAGIGVSTRQIMSSGSSIWQAAKYVTPFLENDANAVQGGVVGAEECYYYRDFPEYKIRIICLNEYDAPRRVYTTDTNESLLWSTVTPQEGDTIVNWEAGVTYPANTIINYKGLYLKSNTSTQLVDNGDYSSKVANRPVAWSSFNRDGRFLSQAQVDFLIGALTTFDNEDANDWNIIIATHQVVEAFDSSTSIIANAKFHDANSHFIKAVSLLQNGNILLDIINAYKNGTDLSQTYTQNTEKIPSNISVGTVTVDAHFNGISRANIICCINGHTHNCGCYWMSNGVLNINQESGCYMPDIPAQATGSDAKYTRFNVSDTIRGGSLAQDCFNIISFDTVNHVVQLLRIGADTTDKHIKRDYARISYEYKTSIPEKSGTSLVPENIGSTRPANPSDGELFFDTTLGKTIIYNGSKWVEEDGASAGVLRMGDSGLRKNWVPSESIYVGFKYYDTSVNKLLTWNGTNWVDSYGTVIS